MKKFVAYFFLSNYTAWFTDNIKHGLNCFSRECIKQHYACVVDDIFIALFGIISITAMPTIKAIG